MMECIDQIDNVYESMNINSSIVVCETSLELAYIVDELESKSYPCIFPSSTKKESLDIMPNKLFVCTKKEFNSNEFWEILNDYDIDCFFFIGQKVFLECIQCIEKTQIKCNRRQFIFTF